MTILIRIDASRAQALGRRMPEAVRKATAAWLLRGSQLVADTMRLTIAKNVSARATGQTAASVRARVATNAAVIGPSPRSTKWGIFDPIYLDRGTRPHEIRPRFAKVLAFARAGGRVGSRGGSKVTVFKFGGKEAITDLQYAMVVHHPGTRGIRFVDKTAQAVQQPLQDLYGRMLDAQTRALSGGAR